MNEQQKSVRLTVMARVKVSREQTWKLWTTPADIVSWNTASDDWHTTKAENDLRPGGSFLSRMEAKDGSFGFDFSGVYEIVDYPSQISYRLGAERGVLVTFREDGDFTEITEVFDAEGQNPPELQQAGWQAILDNFCKYAESRE